MTIQELRDKIATEKQQFQDYKASKEGEIATLNNTIADLQAQLANASNLPDDLDVEGIVP